MGQLTDLVAAFAPRFRPASDLAGAEAWTRLLGEYCEAVKQLGDIEAEIARGLLSLVENRDGIQVELWIHAAITRPSPGLVEPLCTLLSVRDGYLQHEWVADLLGRIGHPRAIPALRDTCSFDLRGDPFRSLPKRCLEALATIGTPEAIAAVRDQLASPWAEVREEAAELLSEEAESTP